MDPNATLNELREVIRIWREDKLIMDEHTLDFVLERIETLDNWCTKKSKDDKAWGGYLPTDWG